MNMHRDLPEAPHFCRSYQAGYIQLNQGLYTESLLISKEQILIFRPRTLEELKPEDLEPILQQAPKLLLFGLGAQSRLPPMSQFAPLFERGIAVEFMSSQAACRTFNLLVDERPSLLAAILVDNIIL